MKKITEYGIDENIVFSVSEVSLHLKQVIETQIESLYIQGEISNFVHHNSGHMYFNLKDENAVIRCAFFKNQNFSIEFIPKDGEDVVCFGKITVFDKGGQYQLIVSKMFPFGKGALQQQFELLKLKLKNEGLFDNRNKKTIPKFPEIIGVITSLTGAALQDILSIVERRYPCNIIVYPSIMQGRDTVKQVINGIKHFNTMTNVDVIIIARGGGSQEDLFAFNDEDLAREIFDSHIPIISAIGHEIDYTISDFVSDLRAPTPSAAGELATPNRKDVVTMLEKHAQMLSDYTQQILVWKKNELQSNQIKIMHFNPNVVLQYYHQRVDESVVRMSNIKDKFNQIKQLFISKKTDFKVNANYLIWSRLSDYKHKVRLSTTKLMYEMKNQIQIVKHDINVKATIIQESSPQNVLKRGFSYVQNRGKVVKSVKKLSLKDNLRITFFDGIAEAEVNRIENNEKKR